MGNILISYIVPVYNAEKYIHRCVDSILKQKWIDLCEIILINDGSQDGSAKICDDYANKYENIFVQHQSNRGQGETRNIGILLARGEWLCFIDNDDWIDEQLISNCEPYICEDTDIIMWAKRDVFRRKTKEYLLKSREECFVYDSEEQSCELQLNTLNFFAESKIEIGRLPLGTPWGKLIKKKLFVENGCRFVCGYGEDRPCMIQIYRYAKRVVILNKILHNYLIHDSTMRKYLPEAYKEYELSCISMNSYVKTNYGENYLYMEALRHFNIAYFSYYVVQDFCNNENVHKYGERKKNFLAVINAEPYKESFQNANLACLPMRRRVLATLSKRRFFLLINIMSKFNSILNKIER